MGVGEGGRGHYQSWVFSRSKSVLLPLGWEAYVGLVWGSSFKSKLQKIGYCSKFLGPKKAVQFHGPNRELVTGCWVFYGVNFHFWTGQGWKGSNTGELPRKIVGRKKQTKTDERHLWCSHTHSSDSTTYAGNIPYPSKQAWSFSCLFMFGNGSHLQCYWSWLFITSLLVSLIFLLSFFFFFWSWRDSNLSRREKKKLHVLLVVRLIAYWSFTFESFLRIKFFSTALTQVLQCSGDQGVEAPLASASIWTGYTVS